MKFPDKFSVSQCEIQIPHCETENIPEDFEEYAGGCGKICRRKKKFTPV